MKHRELFIEIFGEDVFEGARKQHKTDRRTAIYYFMAEMLKMKDVDIAAATGRSRPAVIQGRQRFKGLLESQDKIAIAIWEHMNERIKLLYSELEKTGRKNESCLGK